jgi:uncharacterized membrane protein
VKDLKENNKYLYVCSIQDATTLLPFCNGNWLRNARNRATNQESRYALKNTQTKLVCIHTNAKTTEERGNEEISYINTIERSFTLKKEGFK